MDDDESDNSPSPSGQEDEDDGGSASASENGPESGSESWFWMLSGTLQDESDSAFLDASAIPHEYEVSFH